MTEAEKLAAILAQGSEIEAMLHETHAMIRECTAIMDRIVASCEARQTKDTSE